MEKEIESRLDGVSPYRGEGRGVLKKYAAESKKWPGFAKGGKAGPAQGF
jgi:hypothetical protein